MYSKKTTEEARMGVKESYFTRITNSINSVNVTLEKNSNQQVTRNIIPFYLFEKINELYSSIIDAKNVMLKYKSYIATTFDETDCITPLTESKMLSGVFYKREDLTSIKAYKIRGALYQMSKVVAGNSSADLTFIAASTGNHALGVLKAAEILNVANVTICISQNVTQFKKSKLQSRVNDLKQKGINANLVVKGNTFDETNKIAPELVNNTQNAFYIDPYNTHDAVAGQGTIGLELISQLEKHFLNFSMEKRNKLKEFTVIAPIGGGGLISGISCAMKSAINESPILKHCKLTILGVALESLNSQFGDAIKVKNIGEHNSEYVRFFVEEKIKISDFDMAKGINFICKDLDVKVEGASAGTLAPVLKQIITPSDENMVICVLSGGNRQ